MAMGKYFSLGVLLAVGLWAGPALADDTYLVGVGDVLEVTAFQLDELCGSFQVAEDGTITYPLIGQIKVAGKSITEISSELEKALEKDYFVDVQLQVKIKEFRSKPVVVLGEVRRPGTIFLSGETMLTDIIAEAGGLSPSAGAEIELRRQDADSGKQPEVLVFPTVKVATGEVGRDVPVRAGDVISVSAKAQYFITGEINQAGQYEITHGLTLMRAVSQAGGLSKFASKEVEMHRQGDGETVIETYDLGDIRKGKAKDPEIRAGDVIIVRRRFF